VDKPASKPRKGKIHGATTGGIMRVGTLVKYLGDIGVVVKVWTAYRFPNNEPYHNLLVHFFDGEIAEIPADCFAGEAGRGKILCE
jgi:hypothetical protein